MPTRLLDAGGAFAAFDNVRAPWLHSLLRCCCYIHKASLSDAEQQHATTPAFAEIFNPHESSRFSERAAMLRHRATGASGARAMPMMASMSRMEVASAEGASDAAMDESVRPVACEISSRVGANPHHSLANNVLMQPALRRDECGLQASAASKKREGVGALCFPKTGLVLPMLYCSSFN